jgi:hypothetical protein
VYRWLTIAVDERWQRPQPPDGATLAIAASASRLGAIPQGQHRHEEGLS